VQERDPAAILDAIEVTAGERGPALYVHGYYISFEKGCRRAALLQQNAGLAGRFLWFSWPSDGAAAYYTHDEADLYWSVPDLADTIIALDRRFGSGRVDVIGHSLGARGVVLALADVASRHPDIRLGHVVLLAADMDFAIFERILPRIRPIATSLTVYARAGDRPLALSAQLHGHPRLGEAGNDVSAACWCRGHRPWRRAQRRPHRPSLSHLQPCRRRRPASAPHWGRTRRGTAGPCRAGRKTFGA
jgi:esterase/lipase superfamily enzyme